MSKVKAANYTPEQVEEMQTAYTGAADAAERETVVLDIAAKFGKSKRSIISKMSREGFYIRKVAVSKVTGTKPAKKSELANTLRFVSGLPMVSGEKLNKTDLQDLIEHFEGLQEITAAVEIGEVETD